MERLVIDTGDTAFMLISMVFVMIMTPALALFYGGMVRAKNVLNTIMQCLAAIGIISVQWVLFGYSLSFGPDVNHIIGNFDWSLFTGVGMLPEEAYSATIPHMLFALFQMMFAIITAGIITGAFVERMRFGAFLIFIALWTTLVYDPVAHWVWGVDGWLRNEGVLDFAGGTVIHILSGISGLVAAMLIGKRAGYGRTAMIPHNIPMVVIGMAFLWLGWFGFNGGSAFAANGLAAHAMVTTQVAAATGMLGWMLSESMLAGKATTLGAASGAIAGLVAITPGAGFVPVWTALPIGFIGGIICYTSVAHIKTKLGYDDSLDAFGIHGVGGLWGAIATGLFASTAVNEAGADGLFFGNPMQLWIQVEGIVYCALYGIVVTAIIVLAMKACMRVRADEGEQIVGMDALEHGERGYAYMDSLGALSFSKPIDAPQYTTASAKDAKRLAMTE
ncbi:ammonium transporter [Veillonella magna]|uniref:Ammonium transporter n=1 Tax=Veillonella magna TaxID=464322 RepID=A0ABS2GJT8_9FIRM|nr:ammonium transporter [Veillonella magna]MBM6825276.1 ammonium transporter [Veillonella magna]MBM6913570.1 ammonium transporter [Veillonella magna]